MLDARRLGPEDEDNTVAAEQLRAVVEQIIAAGHWQAGDLRIWIVGEIGYGGPRLAFLLAELLVRVRSDRVMHSVAPPCVSGAGGRPARHGPSSSSRPASLT